MDYLQVLKVFRKYYGKNQKYYSSIHPILYYSDDFYTNPFLKNEEEKEEIKTNCLEKYFAKDYKFGINRNNFFKLFLSILRKNDYVLNLNETIEQMIFDFDKLNLPREFKFKENYQKITKANMRNIIIEEKFNSWEFMQFCADYFHFKIIFINQNGELRQFNRLCNDTIPAPKVFIYQDLDDRFIQIKLDNQDWLNSSNPCYNKFMPKKRESEELEESDVRNKTPEPEYDCSKLMKLKLKELQAIANELNINIQKMNPRKTRMINKKKDELIADIILI